MYWHVNAPFTWCKTEPLQPWLNNNCLHAVADLFIEDPTLVLKRRHLLFESYITYAFAQRPCFKPGKRGLPALLCRW